MSDFWKDAEKALDAYLIVVGGAIFLAIISLAMMSAGAIIPAFIILGIGCLALAIQFVWRVVTLGHTALKGLDRQYRRHLNDMTPPSHDDDIWK